MAWSMRMRLIWVSQSVSRIAVTPEYIPKLESIISCINVNFSLVWSVIKSFSFFLFSYFGETSKADSPLQKWLKQLIVKLIKNNLFFYFWTLCVTGINSITSHRSTVSNAKLIVNETLQALLIVKQQKKNKTKLN